MDNISDIHTWSFWLSQVLIIVIIPAAGTLLVKYLKMTSERNANDKAEQREALESQAKTTRIMAGFLVRYLSTRGPLSIDEEAIMDELFELYRSLGGNGLVEKKYKDYYAHKKGYVGDERA